MPETHVRSRPPSRFRTPPRGASLPLLVAALAACVACADSGTSPEAGVTRTDSAGIEIVASPDRVVAVRRLSAVPRVAIGQLDGPEELQLFRVVGARRLSDGRLAIANAGSGEIRLYGSDGAHLLSVGGEGEGPGEFTRIVRLDTSPEDSLYAWDLRQFRLSVFEPSGKFVRGLKLETPWEGAFPNYSGRFDDGTLLVVVGQVISRPPPNGEVFRGESSVLRYGATGQFVDTIAAFTTGGSMTQSLTERRATSWWSIPFDAGTRWTIDGRGLHATYGPRFEVRTLDPEGTVTRIARIDRPPVLVDAELRAAAVEAELVDLTDEGLDQAREAYAMMPFPDSVAAYDQLLSDATGRVWARRYPLPGQDDALWDVLDPTGALEAEVVVPEAMTVWQVGDGWLLGSERDELDVERVVLYDVEDASR